MAENSREQAMHAWLAHVLNGDFDIRLLAGDASFRRYFRIMQSRQSWVLMDAPPGHEDVRPFLNARAWFENAGLRVSALIAQDCEQGFLLLEDFGDLTWAKHKIAGGDLAPLFEDALRQLHLLQSSEPDFYLPEFDVQRMQSECDLYLDWYLPHVAGYEPSGSERAAFHAGLRETLDILAKLPRVPVHLDYHSRNLMLPDGALPLAQIDYQDAVMGPVTYDLASLLYDCYQDYPESEREHWSKAFFSAMPSALQNAFSSFVDWHSMLRMTALQRHIKAIGIFARLAHRDGKRQFLDEIPLTRRHLCEEMTVLDIDQGTLPLLYRAPA
ncbi:MAG: aminoglycoside phosphotransferase family protein [Mariprofundaceae bacterium]